MPKLQSTRAYILSLSTSSDTSHGNSLRRKYQQHNCTKFNCQRRLKYDNGRIYRTYRTAWPDDEQANTSTHEKILNTQNNEQVKDNSTGEASDHRDIPENNMEQDTVSDALPPNNNEENNMDFSIKTKRPRQTDSDSDPTPLPCHQRIKPAPNTNATRHSKKNKDKNKKQ